MYRNFAVVSAIDSLLERYALTLEGFAAMDNGKWEVVITGRRDDVKLWAFDLKDKVTSDKKDEETGGTEDIEIAYREVSAVSESGGWATAMRWIFVLLLGAIFGVAIPLTVVRFSA